MKATQITDTLTQWPVATIPTPSHPVLHSRSDITLRLGLGLGLGLGLSLVAVLLLLVAFVFLVFGFYVGHRHQNRSSSHRTMHTVDNGNNARPTNIHEVDERRFSLGFLRPVSPTTIDSSVPPITVLPPSRNASPPQPLRTSIRAPSPARMAEIGRPKPSSASFVPSSCRASSNVWPPSSAQVQLPPQSPNPFGRSYTPPIIPSADLVLLPAGFMPTTFYPKTSHNGVEHGPDQPIEHEDVGSLAHNGSCQETDAHPDSVTNSSNHEVVHSHEIRSSLPSETTSTALNSEASTPKKNPTAPSADTSPEDDVDSPIA